MKKKYYAMETGQQVANWTRTAAGIKFCVSYNNTCKYSKHLFHPSRSEIRLPGSAVKVYRVVALAVIASLMAIEKQNYSVRQSRSHCTPFSLEFVL